MVTFFMFTFRQNLVHLKWTSKYNAEEDEVIYTHLARTLQKVILPQKIIIVMEDVSL